MWQLTVILAKCAAFTCTSLSLPLSEYGMSRSATLVLAYIMKCNRMALSQAMDFVKERKPDIRLVVYILRIEDMCGIGYYFILSLSLSLSDLMVGSCSS